MKIKLCLMLFVTLLSSNSLVAQEVLNDTIMTLKEKDDFVTSFKKNVAIDKEGYNIIIDYVEDNFNTLIFSGVAKNVGGLTANSTGAISGTLEFKVELTYQESNEKWLFKPQKLFFTYRAKRNSNFAYLPTSILEEVKDELVTIEIYGPQFELDSYFFKKLDEYKVRKDELLIASENEELKKKERKRAKKEYESVAIKYKVYNDVYRGAKSIMTRLKLYYLD